MFHKQDSRTSRQIRWWQWPNLLAIDAAIIAVAWQVCIADSLRTSLEVPHMVVLALSVWLTYTADHLFDVRNREPKQLLSARHQFAKRYSKPLWLIWWTSLSINLPLALFTLDEAALRNGFILLTCCLAYTLLNQLLSRRFFPKELCVAAIYAGGATVFIGFPFKETLAFAILCLANCLLISAKESTIDAALKVRSLTSIGCSQGCLLLAAASFFGIIVFTDSDIRICLIASAALLFLAYKNRSRFNSESYRVLTDTSLLVGPMAALLA